MHIDNLFDPGMLWWHVENGYVSKQVHPHLPLTVFDYTPKTQYEQYWNNVTEHCRGLVVDNDGNIVANCLKKFYNYNEPMAKNAITSGPIQVTDKLDGSYLAVSLYNGELITNTRGSFQSPQALTAMEIIEESPLYQINLREICKEKTAIFEVIYPENRIVLDYKGMRDIVFIGTIANFELATGKQLWTPASKFNWPGRSVQTFNVNSYAEALKMPPRPNAEGIVVYFENTGQRLKIKQDDYVALHRIITNCSAKRIWTSLAVDKFKHLITNPHHWGTYLHINPAEAEEIIATEGTWIDKLLTDVPDEFYAWVRDKIDGFNFKSNQIMQEVTAAFAEEWNKADKDRKTFASNVAKHPLRDYLFHILDNKVESCELDIWKRLKPVHETPFRPLDAN